MLGGAVMTEKTMEHAAEMIADARNQRMAQSIIENVEDKVLEAGYPAGYLVA